MRAARLINGHPSALLLLVSSFLSRLTSACLLFTGTLSSASPPQLRVRLIDNGITICTIALATNFGPKLPFTCSPGYTAWTDPAVSTIYLEKTGKLFGRYLFSNIERSTVMFWYTGVEMWAEQLTLLEAANYGCIEPEAQLAAVKAW